MKKLLAFLAALLLVLPCAALADSPLRGYVKGKGYQYVSLGSYPYEADGAVAPVLWRILDVQDGQALLLTEYVIDVSQVIFETDARVIEKQTYRRINSYAESDLYTHLNTTVLDTLLGDDPLRGALIDEPGGGKLFILTDEQFLSTEYGFVKTRWSEQKSRQAVATPYALSQGLFREHSTGTSPYWVATIRSKDGVKLALVGYNGHLSWGAYTRTNVGLRLSVRLDMAQLRISGGAGTKDDPFLLEAAAFTAATEAPIAEATVEPDAESIEEPAAPDAAPTEEPSPAPAPASSPAAGETSATISFVGDCSIGDSFQYKKAASSYHTCIDQNGYDWPFSLVKDVLAADDLTVANLEVVFTARTQHTNKTYNLVADADHVAVLNAGSIELVNTVNNHCMDFGRAGYQDSLATLEAAGVDSFGSIYPGRKDGYDRLGVRDVNGIRFGFIGFSYPQEADQKRIAKRIATLREQGCDVVVVSLHWGRETHPTPTTGQMTYAKKIIDAGADMIWGHHPHVLQPIQFYNGRPILYSTGNFTFGTMSNVDPATGIFQLTYQKKDGRVQLAELSVVPCQTQRSPDFRPIILTEEAQRQAVFGKLMLKKEYKGFENPPASFLETGVIRLENGQLVP